MERLLQREAIDPNRDLAVLELLVVGHVDPGHVADEVDEIREEPAEVEHQRVA